MKRNEEKPLSKTTANVLIGVLIGGLCLGMIKGCEKPEKEKGQRTVSMLNLKNKKQIER